MQLRLFRSLVRKNSERCCERVLKELVKNSNRQYDGALLTLAQLEATPSALSICADHSLRLICQLEPQIGGDAEDLFDRLSYQLGNINGISPHAVELIVMRAPPSCSLCIGKTLDYLGDVLPVAARFLESHPKVGSSHGKSNAHNKPLDNHVIGVCHQLEFDIPQLSELMDVFSPTRLALKTANLSSGVRGHIKSHNENPSVANTIGLSYEQEAVVHGTDLLYATPGQDNGVVLDHFGPGTLFGEVWCSHQLDGAKETYVTCDGKHSNGDDKAAEEFARCLRVIFNKSLAWRNCAADRRAAEHEATAEAWRKKNGSYSVESGARIADAAASFGLDLSKDEVLTRKDVKDRWRKLALKNHPDMIGGSAESFKALRENFRTLLEATSTGDS